MEGTRNMNKDKKTEKIVDDMVDHPSHYNQGEIEVIDAIEDWGLGFHLGSAVKYIARSKHKSKEKEDLQKAMWYIQRFINKCVDDDYENKKPTHVGEKGPKGEPGIVDVEIATPDKMSFTVESYVPKEMTKEDVMKAISEELDRINGINDYDQGDKLNI